MRSSTLPFLAFGLWSTHNVGASDCKCIQGDSCWPSPAEWSRLNTTVDGRLISTTLTAEVCYEPHYNAAACEALKLVWDQEVTQFMQPEGFMAPLFQNQSCDPFVTTPEKQCTMGNYPAYSINVSSASHVVAGLRFTQDKNVRLVIKSTGHDYLGRSTGKGALSLWTHNLKSISIFNYSSTHYSGPAIKMGAGVQGFEAYAAAKAHGLVVVGGECPTVALAGGFTSGGGHSSFTSKYGMAADQALEWEVVTANGTILIATPTQNSDMYWALSGGGAGTYAVVLSLTAKAFPDDQFGGAGLTIFNANLSSETFYAAIDLWEEFQLDIVDAGGVATWFIMPFGLLVNPLGLPGKTEAQVVTFVRPLILKLAALGITTAAGNIQITTSSFSTFFDHYYNYNGPYPYGAVSTAQVTSGRLLPRSLFEFNRTALTNVAKQVSNIPGMTFGGFTGSPTLAAGNVTAASNAVLPGWRNSVMTVFLIGAWNYMAPLADNLILQETLTNIVDPLLKSITPGSGTYMNEANFQELNWKEEFYGRNYKRLLSIKRKYDPKGLFYAVTAVGSDSWQQDGAGRLCRIVEDIDSLH